MCKCASLNCITRTTYKKFQKTSNFSSKHRYDIILPIQYFLRYSTESVTNKPYYIHLIYIFSGVYFRSNWFITSHQHTLASPDLQFNQQTINFISIMEAKKKKLHYLIETNFIFNFVFQIASSSIFEFLSIMMVDREIVVTETKVWQQNILLTETIIGWMFVRLRLQEWFFISWNEQLSWEELISSSKQTSKPLLSVIYFERIPI